MLNNTPALEADETLFPMAHWNHASEQMDYWDPGALDQPYHITPFSPVYLPPETLTEPMSRTCSRGVQSSPSEIQPLGDYSFEPLMTPCPDVLALPEEPRNVVGPSPTFTLLDVPYGARTEPYTPESSLTDFPGLSPVSEQASVSSYSLGQISSPLGCVPVQTHTMSFGAESSSNVPYSDMMNRSPMDDIMTRLHLLPSLEGTVAGLCPLLDQSTSVSQGLTMLPHGDFAIGPPAMEPVAPLLANICAQMGPPFQSGVYPNDHIDTEMVAFPFGNALGQPGLLCPPTDSPFDPCGMDEPLAYPSPQSLQSSPLGDPPNSPWATAAMPPTTHRMRTAPSSQHSGDWSPQHHTLMETPAEPPNLLMRGYQHTLGSESQLEKLRGVLMPDNKRIRKSVKRSTKQMSPRGRKEQGNKPVAVSSREKRRTEKPEKCPECGKGSAYNRDRGVHIKAKHPELAKAMGIDITPFSCKNCSREFPLEQNWKRHEKKCQSKRR